MAKQDQLLMSFLRQLQSALGRLAGRRRERPKKGQNFFSLLLVSRLDLLAIKPSFTVVLIQQYWHRQEAFL